MSFDDLLLAADAAMSEILTATDFQHTAPGAWNRRKNDELNVIQLQKHSSGESFCVNLGVHYIFLPKPGTETPLGDNGIELADCELKLRLTDQPTMRDRWWPIAISSVNQVADLVRRCGFPVFDSYRLDGPIADIEGRDIENGNPDLLKSITKVRACLLLARMHEYLGNYDKCIEAARIGVKLAGMASGPKKALKDILGRVEEFN